MKVTSIDIVPANSTNAITLSFRDPTSQNPYIAKEILGLDADEIIAKYYGSDSADNKYYDLSPVKRDIIVKVSLNPDFAVGKSYSDLRDDLYRLIASSRTGAITLKFKNGTTEKASVSGFVTKFEAPNFTKTPEVQITVSCRDAMLKAVDEVNVALSVLDTPFKTVTDSESTAPHGFRFGVIMQGTVVDFSVQDSEIPNWAFEVNLTGSSLTEFVVGDELHFSSEVNNRYLYLVRGFDIIHLVDKIIPTSIWPVMFPGDNPFILSELARWDYITHYPTYWGV
jgi:hypothetical protein